MDSEPIAAKVEALKPEPSLHLEAGFHREVADAVRAMMPAYVGLFMNAVYKNILPESSKSWYAEDKFRRFGMTLDELEAKTGPDAYETAQPGLEKLKQALTTHKNDAGPFLLGSTPSYGDLVATAMFEGLKRALPDQLEKVLSYDDSFSEVYEACKKWTLKAD